MVQRYETIIAHRYEGMQVAQQVLADLRAMGAGMEALGRQAASANVNPLGGLRTAFTGLDTIRTEIRLTDELLRKKAQLSAAEIARHRFETQRLDPSMPKYIQDPALRAEADLRSRTRLARADEVYEKAKLEAAAEYRRQAEMARREAVLGPLHDRLLRPDGGLNLPSRSDPRARALDDAVSNARKTVAAQASLDNWWLERQWRLNRAEEAQREKDAAAAAAQRQRNLNAINQMHYKRIQAEDAAARAEVEGQRQRGVYEGFTPTYGSPDLDTPLGRAQEGVNRAERALEVATQQRTTVLNNTLSSARQLHASELAVERANLGLANARRALAVQEHRPTGIREQFMHGFRGASERPYAEQVGQAFKFSVFYGTAYKLLFAITQTFQQTLQEGIAFQQAMTELKIASGASAEAADKMAESLGRQAVAAGQAPSVGVQIGAASLGLYGATQAAGASFAEQQRVADITNRTVTRMALGSELPITELTTQLAAVANAFDTGVAGQIRAADLDAYLGREYGVDQGKILQAVAESANVGQAAGFTQEQISAIAGAMISGTGQSPSTASGWMAQLFSRGGEGSLTALTQRYGIDQNARLIDQLAALSEIYKTASDQERNEILATGGRGKVQNAMEILIGNWDQIMRVAQRSETEATGASEDVAQMRLRDIGAQIQTTVAAMQAFASELGRSGLLDILGAGVVAFREFVEATTELLRMWNSLDGALRAAIAALAVFAFAARTNAGLAAAGTLSGLARGSAASRGVNLASVMAPYDAAFGTTTPDNARGGGGGARGALAAAGPWIAAAAGLYAIGELAGSAKELKAAQKTASDALNQTPLALGATADEMRARGAELTQAATATREAASGSWMNKVIPSSRRDADELRADADQMDKEAARLAANAKLIENAAVDAASGVQSLISGFDEQGLAASLDAMAARGASASEQMDALGAAIAGAGEEAGVVARYDSRLFAAQNADPLIALLGDSITGIDGKKKTPTAVRNALDGIAGTPELGIQRALGAAGIAGFEDFDITGATRAAEQLVQQTEGTQSYIGTEEYNTAVGKVRDYLMDQARAARLMVDSTAQLTSGEGMLAITNILKTAAAMDATTQEQDFRGSIRNQRTVLRNIRRTIARTTDPGEEMFVQLDVARREMAQRQFNELENMRRAAQRNARSRAEVAAVGRRFLRRELRAAIRGGNMDLLAEIIGQAGGAGVAIARSILQQAINAANEARRVFLQIMEVRRQAQSILGAEIEFVRGGLATMPGKNTEAEGMLGALGNMQSAGDFDDDVYSSGSDVPGYEPPKDAGAGKSKEDKKAEREQARQEMLDLKNNLYLLSIDLSDPLARAVAAVKDARRRLQSDRASGQDRNTIAASRVALRQAQIEREATAFQQRLEAMQTAEDLGRISHQKYISYLENERRRLGAIKNRTYQQQQQLDEIDRLMKDAAEAMQGQWNFGDIALPTPYQVRRQVEQMRLDRATQLDATSRAASSVTTIHIDGADTGKVRQIIHETLSKSNATVTNRPRRR